MLLIKIYQRENMLLLQPFYHSIRNRFFRGRMLLRTLGILIFGATLFTALYFFSHWLIKYFHSQDDLGIILSLKIFQMAWMIMFAMLLFSSMVSAVSSSISLRITRSSTVLQSMSANSLACVFSPPSSIPPG